MARLVFGPSVACGGWRCGCRLAPDMIYSHAPGHQPEAWQGLYARFPIEPGRLQPVDRAASERRSTLMPGSSGSIDTSKPISRSMRSAAS